MRAYAFLPKKPGFFPNLWVITRLLGKKPGFWTPMRKSYIVENITGENVTVNKNLNVCLEKARSPTSPANPQPIAKQPRIDLGDAPEISTFFDRTSELSTLENWILGRTRLITILGLSRSGKSAIALQLIQHIQYEFDCIIWRSLRNAPPLQTPQTDLIKFLSQQQETNPPTPPC
jgi:hypothetical protein